MPANNFRSHQEAPSRDHGGHAAPAAKREGKPCRGGDSKGGVLGQEPEPAPRQGRRPRVVEPGLCRPHGLAALFYS